MHLIDYTFYVDEKNAKAGMKIDQKISMKYKEIGASLGSTKINEQEKKEKRIIPIQLTPQRLAEFLGASECIWVIEDFHKVKEEEKTKLAQVLKVFMDSANEYPKVKIVCIGAVATARELIHYDNELTNRVAEIYVPLMSADDLGRIAKTGFNLLNVSYSNQTALEKIVQYSNGLASVCHHLGYNICDKNGIQNSKICTRYFSVDDVTEAVGSYIKDSSDSFMDIYERACSIPHCKALLEEIIETTEEHYNPRFDSRGNELSEGKQIEKEKILNSLCTTEYGEIFRIIPSIKVYTFSSPLFHTFIKMKFSLEKTKRESKKTESKNELYELINDSSRFIEYIQMLDSFINLEITDNDKDVLINRNNIIHYNKNRINKDNIRQQNLQSKRQVHNYYKKR